MQLRPYQIAARDAVLSEWRVHDKTLLVLPTGCGKTVVFASVAAERVKSGGRVLILAHRGELLDQAADKIQRVTGLQCAREQASESAFNSALPITVGSVQTLQRENRLNQFAPDYFDTIIVDEAHHCLSDTYQRVLNHFDAKVLGVTATPDRGDRRNLGKYFESCAYDYSMRAAIKDRYLCPIRAQLIPLELDISNVSVNNGDYSAGEIGNALEPYLEQIAAEIADNYSDRKTVVFLPLIHISQKFCAMLRARGIKAAEVNGESTDRAEILSDFESGKYSVLCNSMLLTEGWDCPSVDCVVVLRPTKIRSLYLQMVGRGMRLFPGKNELLLLDFLWLTERHDLCRPSSIIAQNAQVATAMDKHVQESAQGIDLLDAEAEAEKDVVKEREQALAAELEAMRKRQRALVDPMQYALSIAAEDLANYEPVYEWEMAPATEKQLKLLEKRGIFPDEVANAGMAARLIDHLMARQQEGLATPKQIRLLERKGFRHVGTWTFDAASRVISILAVNSWIVPAYINPLSYQPA